LEEIIDSYETTPGFGLPLGNQTSQWFALCRFHRLQKAYAQERMDFAAVKRSMASTKVHLMHGNTYLLRRRIERETVFTHGG
jgi:hypothetical protein